MNTEFKLEGNFGRLDMIADQADRERRHKDREELAARLAARLAGGNDLAQGGLFTEDMHLFNGPSANP